MPQQKGSNQLQKGLLRSRHFQVMPRRLLHLQAVARLLRLTSGNDACKITTKTDNVSISQMIQVTLAKLPLGV